MTMITIGPYTVGEIPSALTYEFLDADGAALDLDGYTATFDLYKPDDTTESVAASLVDATASHTWTDDDLDQPGNYHAEFWVTNGTTRYASEKIYFRARDAITTADE